ncbi:hypothetical protein BLNAU_16171 [Blattamonas nauphoetae]|uniref:Uncharacterized protein n=1 Tax=Blattamonas nauphoetae TaxID=2049346 RepID=A0ABQ9X8N0_9EUKA|nr:hypothetical protein BLNAU_16171 [Blattamonas nauphoetae]
MVYLDPRVCSIEYSKPSEHIASVIRSRYSASSKSRTDLCELSDAPSHIQEEDRRGVEKTLQQREYDEDLKLEFEEHVHRYHTQRKQQIDQKPNLQPFNAIVMTDYMQHLFLPIIRNQLGHSFFFTTYPTLSLQRHPC